MVTELYLPWFKFLFTFHGVPSNRSVNSKLTTLMRSNFRHISKDSRKQENYFLFCFVLLFKFGKVVLVVNYGFTK